MSFITIVEVGIAAFILYKLVYRPRAPSICPSCQATLLYKREPYRRGGRYPSPWAPNAVVTWLECAFCEYKGEVTFHQHG